MIAVKDRVKHHRAVRQQQNLRRLDAWISQTTMTDTRRIARGLERPVGVVVDTALQRYLADYRALVAEGKRLQENRAHLLPFVNVPEYQHLIRAYHEQLATFNRRLDRFLHPSPQTIQEEEQVLPETQGVMK